MESFGLLQLLKALTPSPPPETEKSEENSPSPPSAPPPPEANGNKENACLSFFEAHDARSKRTKPKR